MEPSSLSEQLIDVSLEVEPSSLSEELKNLKSEVVSMKRVMVDSFAFENQFLKIKQQLAEIIDEISTIKSTVAVRQPTVAVRQQTLKNENDAPANTLNFSSATQGNSNTSKSHSFLALEEQLKGQWLTIGIVKENFSKLQQDVTVQSLKSTEHSKILQSVIEQQKYMEEQINLLHAKLDPDSQTQHKIRKHFTQNIRNFLKALKHKKKNNRANKTLRRVKKLECRVAISLRNGRSFIEDIVEKRMQCLTESVEDNTYDTQQCWKMLEEIQEAEHYFMLNGDKVKLEDKMSQLIFGQETLLALSEEQMNSIVKIQDDISGKSISEMFGWNFSHKDLLSSLKDVGDKYEMMKVLFLKRFEGLDSCLDRSKNFGKILNIMTKNQQVLGKQVDLLKNDVDCIKASLRAQAVNMVVKFRKFPIRDAKGTPVTLNAPYGTDSIMKSGTTRDINTRHQCITAMTIYENKSLEELRDLDYREMDAEIKSEYQCIISSLAPFTSFGNQVTQVADPSLATSQIKLPSTPLFQLASNTKSCSGGFNTITSTTSKATAIDSPFGVSSSSFVPVISSASLQIIPSPSPIPKKVLRRTARHRVETPTSNSVSVISSLFTNSTISGASANQLGSTTTSSGLFGPSITSSGLFGPTSSSSGLFGPTITSSGLLSSTTSSTGLLSSTTSSSGLLSSTTSSSGLFGSTSSSSGLLGSTTSSSGLLGSTASSSGLFGSTTTSSGLFGQSISYNITSSGLIGPFSSSSGLFGPTSTSSGLFGQSITSSALFGPTSSSSGLLSSTTSSSGLFGPTSSSSGLFGSTTTSSGLFGQSTTSSGPSTASSGLFGPISSSSGLFRSTELMCKNCGKDCHSRIKLHSHSRKCNPTKR